MKRYNLLVSQWGRKRRPQPMHVDSDDIALAVFEAWLAEGGGDRPNVYPDPQREGIWISSDGMQTVQAQVLSIDEVIV